MTLVVVLRSEDGLVIAGDSRGTIGDPRGLTAINDEHIKLFRLSKYCGLGVSGATEFASQAISVLQQKLEEEDIGEYVDQILERTRGVVRELYDNWFQKFPVAERPLIALTLAGYAHNHDGSLTPKTYLISSQFDFAPQLFPLGNSLVGIPQYAVYLLHRFYDPKMKVESLARLAAYLISETATQDPKVGGPIRIATITKRAGYSAMTDEAAKAIVKKNTDQSKKLKEFFLKNR
jgi:20S proteasome alpha/beta subunit